MIQIDNLDIPPTLRGSWPGSRLPRFFAMLWLVQHGQKLSHGSRYQAASAIEHLYATLMARAGRDVLDQALGALDGARIQELLAGYYQFLANECAFRDVDVQPRWLFVAAFMKDTLRALATIEPGLTDVADHLESLDPLYGTLIPSTTKKASARIRALPPSVVSALLERADPEAEANPFATPARRWCVFVLLLVLLFLGLRRGEALLLKRDCIHEGIVDGQRQIWVNVTTTDDDVDDPRWERPSLKTPMSHRQVAVEDDIAELLLHYRENHRPTSSPYPYLLMSSHDRPLSLRTASKWFDVLSGSLPESARQDLLARNGTTRVTPHDCRHTCAVDRLSAMIANGSKQDIAIENLRSFFGWSPGSDMPFRYAEQHFQSRMMREMTQIFSDRVKRLRTQNEVSQRRGNA